MQVAIYISKRVVVKCCTWSKDKGCHSARGLLVLNQRYAGEIYKSAEQSKAVRATSYLTYVRYVENDCKSFGQRIYKKLSPARRPDGQLIGCGSF